MLSALALTYLVPVELLLLAYVVLGPAHYATEISWLHDRKYFLPRRGIALGLAAVAVIAASIDNAMWFGFVMWTAFVVCALLVAATALQATVLFIGAIALTAFMLANGASLAALGILLPTLIHVSLFTLVFAVLEPSVVNGAVGADHDLSCGGDHADPRDAADRRDAGAGIRQGGERVLCLVAPALGRLFGVPGPILDNRIVSLLAFVYTYHYLNWFIKAEVIRWADISRERLAIVIFASAASTALYFTTTPMASASCWRSAWHISCWSSR